MISYNVYLEMKPTLNETEWQEFMVHQHIPDVMKTGCFKSCHLMKVKDEDRTWHIQYFLESVEEMNQYQSRYASTLKQEVVDRYPNKFKAHRTITEIVQSF